MYTTIPKEWRNFSPNVTLEELNNVLVKLHVPTIVFISILIVIGVFGNILVLYIYTTKYHSSAHRCFILFLAWIDTIACAIGMPGLLVSMVYPYMFPSEEACKIFRFLHVFLVVGSALIVIAIAIERHRRICFPFSLEISLRKIKLMCIVALVIGFLVAIPTFWVYGDSPVETGVNNITGIECYINPKYVDTPFPQLYYMFQLLLTLVCMFILAIFYVRIGRQIWWHHRFIRDNTYTQANTSVSVAPKTETRINTNTVYTNGVNKKQNVKVDRESRDSSTSSHNSKGSLEKLNRAISRDDPYGDLLRKVRDHSRSPSPVSNYDSQSPRTRLRFQSNKSDKSSSGPSLRTRQVTTMLFIITMAFVISFIPHLIIMVIISTTPDFILDLSPVSIAVYNIFLRTFVINNMANPIIYGFVDKKFRAECGDLLFGIFTCGRR